MASRTGSDWHYRWAITGGGTIIGEIGVGAVEIQDGKLVQSYAHAGLGNGALVLDEVTQTHGQGPGT